MDYKFTGSTKSLLPISRAIPLQESIGQESQSTSLSHYIHIGAAPTNLIALPDQDNTLLEHHQFKYGTKSNKNYYMNTCSVHNWRCTIFSYMYILAFS